MDISQILMSVVGALFALLSSLAIYFVQKQKEIVDDHTKAITVLQNTAVSDSHVRVIVKEELTPLYNSINKMLESLQKIEVHIAQERGFKEGIAASRVKD